MNADLRVYSEQTAWLLARFAEALRDTDPAALTTHLPALPEANNLLAIAKHAAAVTRAYALGIACGIDGARDRSGEFTALPHEADSVLRDLEALPGEVARAFGAPPRRRLDSAVLPRQDLYGLGPPREMTPREAIVENIRHLGIHLGELRLTRSLLALREADRRAD